MATSRKRLDKLRSRNERLEQRCKTQEHLLKLYEGHLLRQTSALKAQEQNIQRLKEALDGLVEEQHIFQRNDAAFTELCNVHNLPGQRNTRRELFASQPVATSSEEQENTLFMEPPATLAQPPVDAPSRAAKRKRSSIASEQKHQRELQASPKKRTRSGFDIPGHLRSSAYIQVWSLSLPVKERNIRILMNLI